MLLFRWLPAELRGELVRFVARELLLVVHEVGVFAVCAADVRFSRRRLCAHAARHGWLGLLRWARQHRCVCIGHEVSAAAAGGGHVAVLEWAVRDAGLDVDVEAAKAAARGGHVGVLQWLRVAERPWWLKSARPDQLAADCEAARGGRPDALKRLLQHDVGLSAAAARSGDVTVLEWLHAQGMPISQLCMHGNCEDSRWELIRWLYARGCSLTESVICGAACRGDVDLMAWAYERGAPLAPEALCGAAAAGHLDAVEWLAARGCEIGKVFDVFTQTIAGGHLGVLKWLLARRRPSPHVLDQIATLGRLQALKVMVAHGVKVDVARLLSMAVARDNHEVVAYLRKLARNPKPGKARRADVR